MAGIVAYKERESMHPETGVVGIIRDEWRIKPIASYNMDDLYAAFGPNWTSYNPGARFVLEHRYIRRGVDEGWKKFDVYKTREKALEAIDRDATPVGQGMSKVKAKRALDEERQRVGEAAERESLWVAEGKRLRRGHSELAFRRMLEGKNAIWGQRYNEFVEAHKDDAALLATMSADSALYDAVMDAVTIPTKVKAIKAFLARYASAGGKRRRSGGRTRSAPRHALVCRCGHTRFAHRPRCTTPGCFCYGFEEAPTCARCGETAEYCRCPGGMVEKAAGKRRHAPKQPVVGKLVRELGSMMRRR
jgi:hypothetical protein